MTTPKKIEDGGPLPRRLVIDALKQGERGRIYRVGTFATDGLVTAYLRDYNPQWSGCIEYWVAAYNGDEAKRAAIKERKTELVKSGDDE